MNVHKNARLTPQGRLLLVRRITEEGWRIADAAQAAGISERQSYRWAVAAAGLKHKRTRPYTPRTNGKAERFIQTALREWAYARTYQNSQERTAALLSFNHQYNLAQAPCQPQTKYPHQQSRSR